MGYYSISFQDPCNASASLALAGGLHILNATIPAFDAVLNPVLNHIETTYTVEVTHTTYCARNMYEWWQVQFPPGAVAMVDSLLGSRLLDERALSSSLAELAEGLSTA